MVWRRGSLDKDLGERDRETERSGVWCLKGVGQEEMGQGQIPLGPHRPLQEAVPYPEAQGVVRKLMVPWKRHTVRFECRPSFWVEESELEEAGEGQGAQLRSHSSC